MVAEVEAIRQSVDDERQRLAERCAALDRDKRQADATARAESDKLTEQVSSWLLNPLENCTHVLDANYLKLAWNIISGTRFRGNVENLVLVGNS